MSVLTMQNRPGGCYNRMVLYTDEAPENPTADLTLYVSSILTEDNVSRLKEFTDYLNGIGESLNLQEAVYHSQQVLGTDLLEELRVGAYSPLMRSLSASECMLTNEDPFYMDIVPSHFRVFTRNYFRGFTNQAIAKDCVKHRLFVSALYNLVYLLRYIKSLPEAWLLSLLLARVHDVPDSCLDNAKAAATGVLFDALTGDRHYWQRKPRVLPPVDRALMSTYYQLRDNIDYWDFSAYSRVPAMLHIILAAETTEFVKPDLPKSVLKEAPYGHEQTVTPLLPRTCKTWPLGTTGFYIPILHAVSDHYTNVMLYPATKECYLFLCKLYGVTPCDGITPLSHQDMMMWEALFHPHMLASITPVTNYYSDYTTGKIIFNKTASLTDYIPGLEPSDSPRYKVNEFEVPRRSIK